jgi:signal transduction histidine kinase
MLVMQIRPKILLVDDREDNLMSLQSILEPDNYRITKANSGRQVLKILLSEFDFALILMDVKMPNLNGFETAALIYEREKLRHIPIVFITANSYGEEYVFKGYRTGAVDYIYKPVNPDLLRAKVSVFVELHLKNHRLAQQEQKLTSINKELEREISERKVSEKKVIDLNQQLLENIAQLESVNKELDLFAFMASHDLQAPLRKIKMFSDRLSSHFENSTESTVVNYLARIQLECKRMQNLINDILEFSKLSGEQKVFSEVSMNELMTEIVEELEQQVTEKNGNIIVEELPVLCVNADLMRPLFLNLIENALKYSDKERKRVVRIYANGNNNSNENKNEIKYHRIFVEDNGIGFEQKHAEEIFKMFRRLHAGPEYNGTGIGLALCKRIVEKHNGFISAKSKPGEGTTFTISFPFDKILDTSLATTYQE